MKFNNYYNWVKRWHKVLWIKTPNITILFMRWFIFNDINRWIKCKKLIWLATFKFHSSLYEENIDLHEENKKLHEDNMKLITNK